MRRRASRPEMRQGGATSSTLLGAPSPSRAPPFRQQQQPASLHHSNKGGRRLEGQAEEGTRTNDVTRMLGTSRQHQDGTLVLGRAAIGTPSTTLPPPQHSRPPSSSTTSTTMHHPRPPTTNPVDEKKNNCACLACVKQLAGEVDIRQCLEGDKTHPFWTMKPGELYDTNKPFFHQYKYTNFRTNLNALKKSIRTNTEQVEFDEQAFKVESNAFPRGAHTSQGNPYYDTSDARVSLVKDVADSEVVNMYRNAPLLLRATKPEYQCFKPNVFTKHFNREIRRKKEAAGWQHRRNLQGSKNHLQRLNELEK